MIGAEIAATDELNVDDRTKVATALAASRQTGEANLGTGRKVRERTRRKQGKAASSNTTPGAEP